MRRQQVWRLRGGGGWFCRTPVLLQPTPSSSLARGVSAAAPRSPYVNGSVSYQHAAAMEARRLRALHEASNMRFTVVKETTRARNGRAIGIDLGTTNSCISYIDHDTRQPRIIPSPTGSWVFPTAVTFDNGHQLRVYGEEARAYVRTSSSATLCSGKRLIGRQFGELAKVHGDLSKTNTLALNEKGEVVVEIMGRSYTIVHIIAMFLRYLRKEAERYLKEPVELAVVSVPADFTPRQKVATEDAALCAGFDVLEIIDEPSAACLAYTALSHASPSGTRSSSSSSKDDDATRRSDSTNATMTSTTATNATVTKTMQRGWWPWSMTSSSRVERSFVFDLGGGTLDCAIMEHDRQHPRRRGGGRFALIATHGDPMLGGNDWDNALAQHFISQFETKWRVSIIEADGNVAQGVSAHRNVLLEAERAKIHFTHSTDDYHGYNRGFHFSKERRDVLPLEVTLTHAEYVQLTRPLRVRCLTCVQQLLARARVTPGQIDNVLLVGAMTRDPPVRHMLREYFGRPAVDEAQCPADYAVAIGAAVRAGMLQGAFPELTARTRFAAGTWQWLREGNVLQRGWRRLCQRRGGSRGGYGKRQHHSAVGAHWRGRAVGLRDEEIADYAKELVQFEAAQARRNLLECAENEANAVMRRVTADATQRQGMHDHTIRQLAEQLKFWQYMVHNFHEHEDELLRTAAALRNALDELDGLVADNTACLTQKGTIDFVAAAHRSVNRVLGKAEDDTAAAAAAAAALAPPATAAAAAAASTSAKGTTTAATATPPPRVLLRKPAPLPSRSDDGQELVRVGHPVLRDVDVDMTESVRAGFLEEQVANRTWHEPPAPPGETGSWHDVDAALKAGELVGGFLPHEELVRPMTMLEMLQTLQRLKPIDPPASDAHAQLAALSLQLQTMHVERGGVDMHAIQDALDAEDAAAQATARRPSSSSSSSASSQRTVADAHGVVAAALSSRDGSSGSDTDNAASARACRT